MKKLLIALLILTSVALTSCAESLSREEANNYCESQGKFRPLSHQNYNSFVGDVLCVTPYQYCSEIVRETYYDIVDTVATQSNQQDTISKSMSEQIEKCLSSVKK